MPEIRVRFAPSPTGHLHIGGARTALFNYLFARHQKGKFILRIEDTDQERSTEEATAAILEAMAWLGFELDEGPFFQSQTLKRHQDAAHRLLAEGKAYRCFCTPAELDEMRKRAEATGQKPRYDGRCRHLTQPPAEKRASVIRFKTPPEGKIVFSDLVRGTIEFQCQELDDLIILRSDQTPTYNLSVVVDDIDMRISHVIRGDDHLNNTPRQILLYEALGAQRPVFAHLSMILGPDKKKLSKRHNVPSVLVYREMGFLPAALINYLVRLGWSHGDQEIFSREELIQLFDLSHVGSAPAALNPDKLLWINSHYLRTMPAAEIWTHLRPMLMQNQVDSLPDEGKVFRLMELVRERSKTLCEMVEGILPLVRKGVQYDEAAVKKFLTPEMKPLLQELIPRLAGVTAWNAVSLKASLEDFAREKELKFVQIAQPLRVCLTGSAVSPGIFDVLEVLEKEPALARLQAGLTRSG